MGWRTRGTYLVVWLALVASACARETTFDLGRPRQVADGVWLYQINDASALDILSPMSIQMLRLDPSRVELRSVVANDRVMSLETVPAIAARTGALAAINAGFFVLGTGDPTGVLEVDNELVSDSGRQRGAVGISRRPGGPTRLLFDRVSVGVSLRYVVDGQTYSAAVDGVDTTRVRGKLMLYTPRAGADSDTAANGIEWQIDGTPPRVTARRLHAGRTPIPRGGVVLSFGGTVLPTALERLDEGQEVALDVSYGPTLGSLPETWRDVDDIVSGAGLLVHKGQIVTDWSDERLREDFATERHPRTMIGTTRSGLIWLVTVDGRNPQVSVGMTFAELQRLALALRLQDALNLDGGGSTTMVVHGAVVNHPSDPQGPRPVSDALIVRQPGPAGR